MTDEADRPEPMPNGDEARADADEVAARAAPTATSHARPAFTTSDARSCRSAGSSGVKSDAPTATSEQRAATPKRQPEQDGDEGVRQQRRAPVRAVERPVSRSPFTIDASSAGLASLCAGTSRVTSDGRRARQGRGTRVPRPSCAPEVACETRGRCLESAAIVHQCSGAQQGIPARSDGELTPSRLGQSSSPWMWAASNRPSQYAMNAESTAQDDERRRACMDAGRAAHRVPADRERDRPDVDDEHRLPLVEPAVEQPVVDVARCRPPGSGGRAARGG